MPADGDLSNFPDGQFFGHGTILGQVASIIFILVNSTDKYLHLALFKYTLTPVLRKI